MSDTSLFEIQSFAASGAPAGGVSPIAGAGAGTHSSYRKYRPTSFADDDFVGQEHVVNTLRNAITLGRISHAYLFCGPRGTGKTTTARLLAKAVNCLDPDPLVRPCNACAACDAINRNATTDVIEIDAASNRGIDDIRDLRERVKYAPTQLRTKFYIVDEAHQITGAAANAFLKTLEEPPPHTRFVLATTDPEELLPTIVSRCQRFDFRRFDLGSIVSTLRRVANLEGISIDDDALPVLARQATGSMRDALGMLDQVAMYRDAADSNAAPISAETVRTVLGLSRNERVESITSGLADHDAAACLRVVADAVDAGDDIRQLGRQLVAYLRMLLLASAGGTPGIDDIARNLSQRFTLEELAGLLRQLSDLDARARRSAIPQLPLELALVEGARRGHQASQPVQAQDPQPEQAPVRPAERDAPRASLRDQVRGKAVTANVRPQARIQEQPQAPTQSPAAAPEAELPPPTSGASPERAGQNDELSLDTIVELWPQIRADVKALNRRVEAILQQVDPAVVTGSRVVLVSTYEFHRNRVNSDEVRQTIESVISRLVGSNVQITCISREEAQTMREPTPTLQNDQPYSPAAPPVATAIQETASSAATSSESVGDSDPSSESEANLSGDDLIARVNAAKNIFDADEIPD